MLKNEIESLQGKLNKAISNQEESNLIYEISTQLDELIVSYYKESEVKSN